MSEEFNDDTHDKLVKAFMEYSKWNERFERFGYKGSSVQAREALRAIRDLSVRRRVEIIEKRNEIHGKDTRHLKTKTDKAED
jgi:hypothetical protein